MTRLSIQSYLDNQEYQKLSQVLLDIGKQQVEQQRKSLSAEYTYLLIQCYLKSNDLVGLGQLIEQERNETVRVYDATTATTLLRGNGLAKLALEIALYDLNDACLVIDIQLHDLDDANAAVEFYTGGRWRSGSLDDYVKELQLLTEHGSLLVEFNYESMRPLLLLFCAQFVGKYTSRTAFELVGFLERIFSSSRNSSEFFEELLGQIYHSASLSSAAKASLSETLQETLLELYLVACAAPEVNCAGGIVDLEQIYATRSVKSELKALDLLRDARACYRPHIALSICLRHCFSKGQFYLLEAARSKFKLSETLLIQAYIHSKQYHNVLQICIDSRNRVLWHVAWLQLLEKLRAEPWYSGETKKLEHLTTVQLGHAEALVHYIVKFARAVHSAPIQLTTLSVPLIFGHVFARGRLSPAVNYFLFQKFKPVLALAADSPRRKADDADTEKWDLYNEKVLSKPPEIVHFVPMLLQLADTYPDYKDLPPASQVGLVQWFQNPKFTFQIFQLYLSFS